MAKLVNTFNKYFVIPLVLSIILSVSSSIFFTGSNLNQFMNSETKARLFQYSKKKTKPFIYQAHFRIQNALQYNINFLELVNSKFDLFSERLKKGELLVSDQFIRNHLVDGNWVRNNYEEYLTRKSQVERSNIAEIHGSHGLDRVIDKKSVLFKQIQRELAMVPLVKAFDYSNTNRLDSRDFAIFFYFVDTDIFILRPSSISKETLDSYANSKQKGYCKNSDGSVPKIINFKCRPWFLEIMDREFEAKPQLILTNPYRFINTGAGIGQTLCLFKFDSICPESSPKCKILICIDISIKQLRSNLRELNSQIPGFFYSTTKGSLFPFYYPSSENFNSDTQLTSYEFNIYSDYSNKEAVAFNKAIENNLLHEQIQNSEESLKYSKNGVEYAMDFYGINFSLGGKILSGKGSKMYLVHVSNPEFYLFDVVNLDHNKKVAIGCLVAYFLILSGVIILISKSLLGAIAKNIVRPVEHLNKVLTDEPILDNEEDNFLFRSQEVDELFTSLMDLREVFHRMEQKGDYRLLDFINAKRVLNRHTQKQHLAFKKAILQENPLTFTACHSNIGNVCLYLRKYDKAVLHLVEACYFRMNKGLRADLDAVKEDFLEKIQNDFVNAFSEEEKLENITEDPLITEKLESRFPKLIQSSFLFYREIRENGAIDDCFSNSKHSIHLFELHLFDVLP